MQNLPILRDHRSDQVRAPVGDGEEREVGGLLALGDEQREEGAEERLHVAEDEQADGVHDVVKDICQIFGKISAKFSSFSAVSAPIFASRIFWFQLFLASWAASQTRSQLRDLYAPQIVDFPIRNRTF